MGTGFFVVTRSRSGSSSMRRKLNNVPYIADRTDPEEGSDFKLMKSPFSSMLIDLIDKVIGINRVEETGGLP